MVEGDNARAKRARLETEISRANLALSSAFGETISHLFKNVDRRSEGPLPLGKTAHARTTPFTASNGRAKERLKILGFFYLTETKTTIFIYLLWSTREAEASAVTALLCSIRVIRLVLAHFLRAKSRLPTHTKKQPPVPRHCTSGGGTTKG